MLLGQCRTSALGARWGPCQRPKRCSRELRGGQHLKKLRILEPRTDGPAENRDIVWYDMFVIFLNLISCWWYLWYCSSQASVVHILGDSARNGERFQMILICNWQASCRCGLSRGPLWAKPLPAANGSLTESARICRICDTVTILRRICGRLVDVAWRCLM